MIISLVNQKGGVGKTTMAVNIAGCLSEMGLRIHLVDADPQGSVLQWQSISNTSTFDVSHRPSERLLKDKKALKKGFDHVVIDAPPAIGNIARAVLSEHGHWPGGGGDRRGLVEPYSENNLSENEILILA